MTFFLQRTGFRESPYERPNQKWVCGWAGDRDPCPMGPDGRGNCPADAQRSCTPRREGDRYLCARPAVFGGRCDPGPLPDGSCARPRPTHPPCQPRLSLRAKRGRLSAACASATLGLLLLLLGGPWRWGVISPGELSWSHRALGSVDAGGQSCAACHSAGGEALPGWLGTALFPEEGLAEAARCLECHFERRRASALYVHSAPPRTLAAKTAARRGGSGDPPAGPPLSMAGLAGGPPTSAGGEMACATCHREHRGRAHDLTEGALCGSCHVSRFASFPEGHPEFGALEWGRPGISFSHATHRSTHYGDLPFECERCHVRGESGRPMLLRPFEESCSGCHYQGNPDHHNRRLKRTSLEVLQLPYMELYEESLYWPEDSAPGERLTPVLRLLLAGDDDALEVFRDMDAQEADWTPEYWVPDSEELTVRLAEGIQRAILELIRGDEKELAARLGRALDAPSGDPGVVALAEQLSAAGFAIRAYRGRWLPALGEGPEGGPPATEASAEPDWSPGPDTTGWHVAPSEAAVRYRPVAHADPFLRRWTDALASHADAEIGSIAEAGDDGELRAAIRADLFQEMSSTSGGYLHATCLRCHALRGDGDGHRVSWEGTAHREAAVGYARFGHAPHVRESAGTAGCGECHEIAGTTEAGSQSGLLPHRKDQCQDCHRPGRAREDCRTCHRYHFERP